MYVLWLATVRDIWGSAVGSVLVRSDRGCMGSVLWLAQVRAARGSPLWLAPVHGVCMGSVVGLAPVRGVCGPVVGSVLWLAPVWWVHGGQCCG